MANRPSIHRYDIDMENTRYNLSLDISNHIHLSQMEASMSSDGKIHNDNITNPINGCTFIAADRFIEIPRLLTPFECIVRSKEVIDLDELPKKVLNKSNPRFKDIQANVDMLIRKHAINASMILDHKSFMASRSWFMLCPLLMYPVLRKYYNVELAMPVSIQKQLTMDVFGTGFPLCEYLAARWSINYHYSKWESKNWEMGKNGDTSIMKLFPISNHADEAAEIVARWGLPTVGPDNPSSKLLRPDGLRFPLDSMIIPMKETEAFRD